MDPSFVCYAQFIYIFYFFLTPTLQDLGNQDLDLVTYFSKDQIGWMMSFQPRCDQFLGQDFSFVRVHGFIEEPFHLPTYVTNHTLALQIFRQLVVIELRIESRRHETAVNQDHKILGPIVLKKRLQVEGVLTSKLVELGFVIIDDKWIYDLDCFLLNRKIPLVHMSHKSLGTQINSP